MAFARPGLDTRRHSGIRSEINKTRHCDRAITSEIGLEWTRIPARFSIVEGFCSVT